MPANGAIIINAVRSPLNDSPRFTAATIRALRTPTPINAATRVTPNTKVATSFERHGRTSEKSHLTAPAQLRPLAAIISLSTGSTISRSKL